MSGEVNCIKSIEKDIREGIDVNQHKVILAKSFLVNYDREIIDSDKALEEFTSEQGYPNPGEIVIHNSVDKETQIVMASEYLAHKIAFLEAIMELIHADLILALTDTLSSLDGDIIGWTTVVRGTGGKSANWKFDDLMFPVPRHLKKPMSKKSEDFTLFDPDLYVQGLSISNAHHEVVEALYDSVECFKKGLYRPSLVMLGKALKVPGLN